MKRIRLRLTAFSLAAAVALSLAACGAGPGDTVIHDERTQRGKLCKAYLYILVDVDHLVAAAENRHIVRQIYVLCRSVGLLERIGQRLDVFLG